MLKVQVVAEASQAPVAIVANRSGTRAVAKDSAAVVDFVARASVTKVVVVAVEWRPAEALRVEPQERLVDSQVPPIQRHSIAAEAEFGEARGWMRSASSAHHLAKDWPAALPLAVAAANWTAGSAPLAAAGARRLTGEGGRLQRYSLALEPIMRDLAVMRLVAVVAAGTGS